MIALWILLEIAGCLAAVWISQKLVDWVIAPTEPFHEWLKLKKQRGGKR